MAIGCRIRSNFPRPSRELVESFRGLPVSDVADCMTHKTILEPVLRSVNPVPLLGVAFPVTVTPGDNLLLHAALELAQEGDVLVVSGGGDCRTALCGELMCTTAKVRGLTGLLVDGAIRDSQALAVLSDISIYARGVSPAAPTREQPGELGYPVAMGGQIIRPGDLLLGDGDGILVVPQEEAEEIAVRARTLYEKEARQLEAILSGRLPAKPFIADALQSLGVEYTD